KWPNDLVIESGSGQISKLGGVLCERRHTATGEARLIIGVGINSKTPSELPRTDSNALRPAGIAEVFGVLADPSELAREVLAKLSAWLDALERDSASTVIEAKRLVEARLKLVGESVAVRFVDSDRPAIEGRMIGLDDALRLVVLSDDGSRVACEAGEVQRVRQG
ncbi:MAG: hypothetical protein AAF747_08385, partial [Planctomycetota bacterium]